MLGTTIGNFTVIDQLGKGGMGIVWLAEQKEIKTKVAIKTLLPAISQDRVHVQRFFNEAVAVSKIKHAGIAKIFDVGFLDTGVAYLVMEFLEGESLAARLQRLERLSLEQGCEFARQIASVLEATHQSNITHRDLKPDNVFIVPDSEFEGGERIKVLDFGIAKLGGAGPGITATNNTMGTPAYMAPEQWGNSANVDGRADAYSLGCLAFEMMCGRPPFIVNSIADACAQHLNSRPPGVRILRPSAPLNLEALLNRLLAKDPGERPGDFAIKSAFASLSVEVRGVSDDRATNPDPLASTAHAGPAITTLGGTAASVMPAAQPARRSNRTWIVAAAAVACIAAIGLGWSATHGGTAPASPPVVAPPPPPVVAPPPPTPMRSVPPVDAAPPDASPDAAPSQIDAGIRRVPTRVPPTIVHKPIDTGLPGFDDKSSGGR